MSKSYDAPKVTTVGTVADLTKQNFNKVGNNTDQYSQVTPLVGSLVPTN
ncbi:MAG TPA: hypothetical protein VN238_03350 [Solirubrobacteraceae bacterium]|nr:hypothetical protein [Solirubrobacteraceae bacterium]